MHHLCLLTVTAAGLSKSLASRVPVLYSFNNLHSTTKNRNDVPFAAEQIGNFFQEQPRLGNQYNEDALLKSYLKRTIPKDVLAVIEPDLERFGDRVAGEIQEYSLQCEKQPPYVEQYNAWGERVDNLVTCNAWKKMHDISAEEGLIAKAYTRDVGQWSRLYQMVKLYLFSSSSGLYSCPLAMTDGAAKIIETSEYGSHERYQEAYRRLTSTDPKQFWTSGQWMTERRGGSDVAVGTETIARPQPDGSYKLYGFKWFSSATDADMCITLARIADDDDSTSQGTSGLSLFYLRVRDDNGRLNNIQIQKLKNKLGTRQLPTAELLLHGVKAYKISDAGRGVASIAPMLTLTRIHNSIGASTGMRRIVNMARDYSKRRTAFGRTLDKHPLHIQTLSRMELQTRGATLFFLNLVKMLGDSESNIDVDADLMRLLTPVLKLYSAKQAMSVVSEGLECFGGAGYLEDTGLPVIFRDAQVLPIWEGTTNVLSLDLLRTIAKTNGKALNALKNDVSSRMKAAKEDSELSTSCGRILQAADSVMAFIMKNPDQLEMAARDIAYSIARIYIGALFIEHASDKQRSAQDLYCAKKWCEMNLTPVINHAHNNGYDTKESENNSSLVYDAYPNV